MTQSSRQSDHFWSCAWSNLSTLFRRGLPIITGATVPSGGRSATWTVFALCVLATATLARAAPSRCHMPLASAGMAEELEGERQRRRHLQAELARVHGLNAELLAGQLAQRTVLDRTALLSEEVAALRRERDALVAKTASLESAPFVLKACCWLALQCTTCLPPTSYVCRVCFARVSPVCFARVCRDCSARVSRAS